MFGFAVKDVGIYPINSNRIFFKIDFSYNFDEQYLLPNLQHDTATPRRTHFRMMSSECRNLNTLTPQHPNTLSTEGHPERHHNRANHTSCGDTDGKQHPGAKHLHENIEHRPCHYSRH